MNVYSIETKICATAYIKAESEEEAQRLANGLSEEGIAMSDRHQSAGDNICIDGRPYETLADNKEEIAFSPAMTIHGPWSEFAAVELVEENIGEEESADV